jgi:permuted papain-like amidase YaeF/Yiix C92 family enzyme
VGVRHRVVLLSVLLFLCSQAFAATTPKLEDGDIVFQTSRSDQSEAIRRATGSPYTHMGVVFLDHGKPRVLEAVGPVQYTPLDEWIRRGIGGRFVVKRLADSTPLTNRGGAARLRARAERFLGRPYDFYFEWSDRRVYCSELVWKAYRNALGIRIGALKKLREFNLGDPVVAAKLKERYGRKVPRNERVISPASMFHSEKLRTVYQGHP